MSGRKRGEEGEEAKRGEKWEGKKRKQNKANKVKISRPVGWEQKMMEKMPRIEWLG